MNFFKLYIGDYQRDTAHLSIAEHGAYLLMLQHYYATEKPLPIGKALHRMLRAQDKEEREAIDSVVSQFWRVTEQGIVNVRADDEITKANAQAETNGRIAREREGKRKAARIDNELSTNRATNDQPNQTPDTRHQTNTPKPPSAQPDGFASFWSAYPKKVNKAQALKAFKAQRINGELPEILTDLEHRRASLDWLKDNGQFIPNPGTYLTNRKWEETTVDADPYGLRTAL